MPKEAPDHPQVTQDQIDLWLAHPVTKAFLLCLEWKRDDTRDQAGTGKIVDSSNADLTHALIHRSLGQQDAYDEARAPVTLLDHYAMIFRPPPPDDDDDEDKDA